MQLVCAVVRACCGCGCCARRRLGHPFPRSLTPPSLTPRRATQLLKNHANLAAGQTAALAALSWISYLTGLGGNSLLVRRSSTGSGAGGGAGGVMPEAAGSRSCCAVPGAGPEQRESQSSIALAHRTPSSHSPTPRSPTAPSSCPTLLPSARQTRCWCRPWASPPPLRCSHRSEWRGSCREPCTPPWPPWSACRCGAARCMHACWVG